MTNVMTVKKEIRILGLDTCRKGVIIGAVVRGGLYLDGVLRLHGADSTNSRAVAKYVRTSRYYPELRVVMTHDKRQTLNGKRLEKAVGLPLIQVATGPTPGYRRYLTKNGTANIRTRLPVETVTRIVALTWTQGKMPEPLRVSHLIAMSKPVALNRRV
ncbi:hypothetical protein E6H36_03145 [Candidatus Bathyarchaeota archaeon]|nr:MAG: hypothetical protein E6H36_03145 [Candidatus Bathyarchaeota archaeon]TMI31826.1 MAG: hypothetical protein E6H29_03710 [Candidatus Bathyarchaeota archaeon]